MGLFATFEVVDLMRLCVGEACLMIWSLLSLGEIVRLEGHLGCSDL